MKRFLKYALVVLAAVGMLGVLAGYTRSTNERKAVLVALEALIAGESGATHDSAVPSYGPQIMTAYDSTKPTAVADGDAVRALADSYGRPLAGLEPQAFHAQLTDADASDEGVVKAATSANKMYILTLSISCDTALDVTIEDDADTVYEVFYFTAKSGAVKKYDPSAPLVIPTNKALQVQTDTSGNISVAVTGYLAP